MESPAESILYLIVSQAIDDGVQKRSHNSVGQ